MRFTWKAVCCVLGIAFAIFLAFIGSNWGPDQWEYLCVEAKVPTETCKDLITPGRRAESALTVS